MVLEVVQLTKHFSLSAVIFGPLVDIISLLIGLFVTANWGYIMVLSSRIQVQPRYVRRQHPSTIPQLYASVVHLFVFDRSDGDGELCFLRFYGICARLGIRIFWLRSSAGDLVPSWSIGSNCVPLDTCIHMRRGGRVKCLNYNVLLHT